MKRKKILGMVLSGMLAVSMLTGCGSKVQTENSSDASAAKENVQTESSGGGEGALSMAWWGNQIRNERTQQVLNLYQEQTGTTVNGQFFNFNDYWSKLQTLAAGNSLPELLQMDYAYINQYAEKGLLLDLNPYIENGMLDTSNISEDVLAMGKVGDGNYGMASGITAVCLLYNKTLLDENEIEVKDNMTEAEFVELSKAVYEKTGYRANIYYSGLYMEEWSRANGIQIVERKMGAENADSYIPYFELLARGIEEGWMVTPDITAEGNGTEMDPMIYGSSPETMTWCAIGNSSQLSMYQGAAKEGVEIALTTIPTSDTKKSNFLKPSMFFSVSASVENPEEAVKLLDFLINSEDAYQILQAERGIPASSAIVESIADKLTDTEGKANNFANSVVVPNSSPIDPPFPEGYGELKTELIKIEQKVGYGEITPQQAAEEYFYKGNEIF